MRAAIWTAVSSEPQSRLISPQDQYDRCSEAANRIGASIDYHLDVPGESRRIDTLEEARERIAAYEQLYQLCTQKKIDVLFFLRKDRLGRDAVLILQVARICIRNSVLLYDVDAPPRSLDPAEQDENSIATIIDAWQSSVYIDLLVKYREKGMLGRVQGGKFPQRPPFGYEYIDGKIATNANDAQIVKRVLAMYKNGLGGKQISGRIRDEYGYSIPDSRVWQIAKRVWVYAGYVEYLGQRYAGLHDAIISEDDARMIERMVEDRAWNKNYARRGRHLLAGIIRCTGCGRRFHLNRSTAKGKPYTSYRCRPCRTSIGRTIVLNKFEKWCSDLLAGHIYTPEETTAVDDEIEWLRSRIVESQKKLERTQRLYIDGRMSNQQYDSFYDEITAEISASESRIAELESRVPTDIEEARSAISVFREAMDVLEESELNSILIHYIRININPETREISVHLV